MLWAQSSRDHRAIRIDTVGDGMGRNRGDYLRAAARHGRLRPTAFRRLSAIWPGQLSRFIGADRYGLGEIQHEYPCRSAGVGRAPQFFALADFTGDGSPGIAMAEPVGYNDDSLTIDEFTPSFLYRTGKKYQYGQGKRGGSSRRRFQWGRQARPRRRLR